MKWNFKYIILLLFALSTFITKGQSTVDSLAVLSILVDKVIDNKVFKSLINRQIYQGIDDYGNKIYYINQLSLDEIIGFDSLFVKGYILEYFDAYSVECGSDFWCEKKNEFYPNLLESIRHKGPCKIVGFSLFLISEKTKEHLKLEHIDIYNFRKKK